MSNRYIPYGYEISDGNIIINKAEAEIIRQIYSLYLNGSSYKAISELMIKKQIPFSPGESNWNKNKVKRILENERYLGNGNFEQLIDENTFDKVQDKISTKRIEPTVPDLNKPLWDRIICPICKKPFNRLGGKRWSKGYAQFKCSCGHYYTASIEDIQNAIFTAVAEKFKPSDAIYKQNHEALRLANEINRGISKPDDPLIALDNILKAIAAGYASIEDNIYTYEYNGHPEKADMEFLEKVVLTICLAPYGTVEIEYVE